MHAYSSFGQRDSKERDALFTNLSILFSNLVLLIYVHSGLLPYHALVLFYINTLNKILAISSDLKEMSNKLKVKTFLRLHRTEIALTKQGKFALKTFSVRAIIRLIELNGYDSQG